MSLVRVSLRPILGRQLWKKCIPDADGSGGEWFQSLLTITMDKEHNVFLMYNVKDTEKWKPWNMHFDMILYQPVKYKFKKSLIK